MIEVWENERMRKGGFEGFGKWILEKANKNYLWWFVIKWMCLNIKSITIILFMFRCSTSSILPHRTWYCYRPGPFGSNYQLCMSWNPKMFHCFLFFSPACEIPSNLIAQSYSSIISMIQDSHLFISSQLSFLNHYHQCHFEWDQDELGYDS